MRNTVLTNTTNESLPAGPSLHPLFQAFLTDIETQVTSGDGPTAAIGLYVNTLDNVANLIELVVSNDIETLLMLGGADVEFSDLVQAAEEIGDRIESLFKQMN